MRSLAETLGVGHRALYNHYADREALLAAIAAEGFARLADNLGAAQDEPTHLRAYVDFALNNPGLYQVMMERSYRSFNDDEALSQAVDRVIGVSLKTIARDGDDPDTQRRDVMRVWMLAHGGIALHKAGALKTRSNETFAEELLRIAFR
ncbi:MAG: TetR-like C-terminal domain-containing protein [Pseudomonadota bacterium]